MSVHHLDYATAVPRRRVFWALVRAGVFGLCLAALAPPRAVAELAAGDQPLRVFLDCEEGCRFDFIRRELSFVDWVRQREQADVHVIVTHQSTGGGGRRAVLGFVGSGRFQGMDDTLHSTTESGEPEERVQTGLVQSLRLGLVRYLARTPQGRGISVEVSPLAANGRRGHDRWDSWVLTLRAEGETDLEEAEKSYWFEGAASADRVTEAWKISLAAEGSRSQSRFDTNEGEVRSTRGDSEARALVVKSLGEHFSVGGKTWIEHSTYENQQMGLNIAPAVEYDFHPYSESARRQLRLMYAVELRQARYIEETIYGKTRETLVRHELTVALDRREPWGTVEARLEAGHYFNDARRYRVELSAEASLRIAKGLSFNVSGELAFLRDQLSLPRRDATTEEILLEQRQLASGYQAEIRIGVSYSFGSIFNSVVNPRFGQ